jgi:hypothetical protein
MGFHRYEIISYQMSFNPGIYFSFILSTVPCHLSADVVLINLMQMKAPLRLALNLA